MSQTDSILEKSPMSMASLIWSVGEDSINRCHCYGRLCGRCADARHLLDAVRHTHVASDIMDICRACGEDLRHRIHRRSEGAK
jgi:hypothetical protein